MAAKLLLPLLSLSVFYFIFYNAHINGLGPVARQYIADQKLPDFDAPLRTVYTGVEQIDRTLTTLTTFFWPSTDGSTPELTLHSIGFSGTFGSAWMLVCLEAWRQGHAWGIAAFPMIFGLSAQVLTFAFATPLYAALHLYTSPTARKPSPDSMRVPHAVVNAMPVIFIIGYFVPSTMMIVPLSDSMTVDLRQIWIALWQPWPAYVSIMLVAANVFLSPLSGSDRSGRASLRALRRLYAFAFANVAITHLITVVVSLATLAAPALFQSQYLESLHPARVFSVPIPWQSPVPQVQSVGEGVHAFLRWDYLIGSTGTLVWALSLHKAAQKAAYGKVGCFGLAVKTVLLTLVAGPVGAAVELMWERDELVFNEMGGLKREAPAQKKRA